MQHWLQNRFYYRHKLFGSELIIPSDPKQKKPYENICRVCGLEDSEDEFLSVCDCQVRSHHRCILDLNYFQPFFEKKNGLDGLLL